MIEALRRAFELRGSYKRALSGKDGDRVVNDLIKKYVLGNPVAVNRDVTLINLGKQRCAIEILLKVLGSDDAFRRAMEQAVENTTTEV